MNKIWILWWNYDDGSGQELVRAYEDEIGSHWAGKQGDAVVLMSKSEEMRDIRAELKALSSLGVWDQPAESCDEKTMLRRRRWAYLEDLLFILEQNKETRTHD